MRLKKIFWVLAFFYFPQLRAQTTSRMDWKVTLTLLDSNTTCPWVRLNFEFTGGVDSFSYIVFDYEDIFAYNSVGRDTSIKDMKQRLLHSEILIERSTDFMSLELAYSYVRTTSNLIRYDFDVLGISAFGIKRYLFPYPIPLFALNVMDKGESNKVRFHYLFQPNEKYKCFPVNPVHLISNWVDLRKKD